MPSFTGNVVEDFAIQKMFDNVDETGWSIRLTTEPIGGGTTDTIQTSSFSVSIPASPTKPATITVIDSDLDILVPSGREVTIVELLQGTTVIHSRDVTSKGADVEFEYGGYYIITGYYIQFNDA